MDHGNHSACGNLGAIDARFASDPHRRISLPVERRGSAAVPSRVLESGERGMTEVISARAADSVATARTTALTPAERRLAVIAFAIVGAVMVAFTHGRQQLPSRGAFRLG